MFDANFIRQDNEFQYFEADYNGINVHITRRISNGEVLFNAEDVALCLGYKNLEDMMSDDDVLDAYSEVIKEQGKIMFIAEDMGGRK